MKLPCIRHCCCICYSTVVWNFSCGKLSNWKIQFCQKAFLMKNVSSNGKNQSFKNIGGLFSFLLVHFLRKMKMRPCTVIWILRPVENTLPPRKTCPFPMKGKRFFSGLPLTLMFFPKVTAETVTCILLECKQKHLLAKNKQINNIWIGNAPTQVLCKCVQR